MDSQGPGECCHRLAGVAVVRHVLWGGWSGHRRPELCDRHHPRNEPQVDWHRAQSAIGADMDRKSTTAVVEAMADPMR